MMFGSEWGPYMEGIGDRLYQVWEVHRDPVGVIGGHLYEVWKVYWTL